MKKYIITTGLAVLAFAAIAGAQSYSFNSDLAVGSSGPDVVQLQTWLIGHGFSIPAISSGITAKGYFGVQTRQALASYQASVGIPATGYLGTQTRQYLNQSQGGNNNNNNTSGPLRIISPNGGESFRQGSTQTITWTAPQFFVATYVDISLVPNQACAPQQFCTLQYRMPYSLATHVSIDNHMFNWNIGAGVQVACIAQPGYSCQTPTIPDGQYKIQICQTGGSVCDTSDGYFSIYSGNGGSTSYQPVINGIDAPTTLTAGQVGTWNIRATDPYNGTLSYSVLWGDEPGYALTGGTAMTPSVMQSSSFTHSYANAGVYTVTFTVKNSSGGMVQTSSTVQVTNSSSNGAGPLRIVAPNGNEIWQRGTNQIITWTSPYYIRATTANLQVTQKYSCTSQVCPTIAYAPYTIASGISINQNSYVWNVGTATNYSGALQSLPDGQYTVQICETSNGNCDASDNTFTITSGQTSSLPDINIVSPNGGEQWQIGSNQSISVNVTGNPSQVGNQVTAYLVGTNNQQIYLGSYGQSAAAGIRTFNVTVPSTVAAGQYKLLVNLYGNTYGTQQQAYDYSDNYFSVTNSYPYPYTYPTYPSSTPYQQYQPSYQYSQPMGCPAGYVCTPNTGSGYYY